MQHRPIPIYYASALSRRDLFRRRARRWRRGRFGRGLGLALGSVGVLAALAERLAA
jgi:hypothetical protein